MKIYIALKDNLEQIFLAGKIRKRSKVFKYEGYSVTMEHYDGFLTVKVDNWVTLIGIPNHSKQKAHPDFIEVTQNEKYLPSQIGKGSLINANVVIEGADGTGKSTLVRELAGTGILCQDRAVKEISKVMKKEVAEVKRKESVRSYLISHLKCKVVFLYLSNEEELKKRISSREIISDYDKNALVSQSLYLETYNSLKFFDKLFLIDCYQKTTKVLAEEIREII